MRAGIARYTGVHLIAFGTVEPDAQHARLAREGFAPLDPVALQREIETLEGPRTARFTVVRTAAGTMPEGHVQFVEHKTPEHLWQARWIAHPNTACALTRIHLCVADPAEAVARFARYTGLPATAIDGAPGIAAARGDLVFRDAAGTKAAFGIDPPALPWIAGYTLACRDLARAPAGRETARKRVVVPSPALGGVIVFEKI